MKLNKKNLLPNLLLFSIIGMQTIIVIDFIYNIKYIDFDSTKIFIERFGFWCFLYNYFKKK